MTCRNGWRVRLKRPICCSHDQRFPPIKNPEVLEISTVPEYFGTIFIRLLRKIKKIVVSGGRLSFFAIMKTTVFYFSQ